VLQAQLYRRIYTRPIIREGRKGMACTCVKIKIVVMVMMKTHDLAQCHLVCDAVCWCNQLTGVLREAIVTGSSQRQTSAGVTSSSCLQ
jgi:hypothetical protein